MKKIVLAGAGGRGYGMFAKPLFDELSDRVTFAAVFDHNIARAKFVSEQCGHIPAYDNFTKMLGECKPDQVVIATSDHTHDQYIIEALEAGVDVISEKPMTINADKCKAILDAEKRTGKKVTVTFNMRFMPYVARVKQLLMDGVIGDIVSVQLEWMLDTRHGADYFRRWHRELKNSGGLLVHKSTHHFDMINWWLEDEPEEVFAYGTRQFYGPTREERGERCITCDYKKSCEYFYDLEADALANQLYLQAEQEDGYIRDGCIFSEKIDIYDTMTVAVKYKKQTMLNYSLNAHSPYEGWKATINGKKGRIEAREFYSGMDSTSLFEEIDVYNHKGERVNYKQQKATGTHGGGDALLREMLFVGNVADPLGQQAGSWAGAMSLMIGAAANESIAKQQKMNIAELLS